MESETPKRGGGFVMLLGLLAVGGAGAGALVYHGLQARQKSSMDVSGFDLDEVSQAKKTSTPASTERARSGSGLSMITGAMPGMQTGQKVAASGASAATASPSSFAQLIRNSEGSVKNLAERYSRKFPIVQQYGREWMSYPDLKKLNNDYMRNRDPIAFLKGVSASPNFGKLIKKYAGEKPIQDFVKEGAQSAPPGAVGAAMEYLNNDANLKGLVDKVASSLGIPASLMNMASGDPSKIDQNQVMQQVLGNNPELQKHLQNAPPR